MKNQSYNWVESVSGSVIWTLAKWKITMLAMILLWYHQNLSICLNYILIFSFVVGRNIIYRHTGG